MKKLFVSICLSLVSISSFAAPEATTRVCGIKMDVMNVGQGSEKSSLQEVLQDYKSSGNCKNTAVCLIQGGVAVACDTGSTAQGTAGSEAIYWEIK